MLCVHKGNVQLSCAHTQPWMAVHVECVMAATFMDEPVSTENDSPILLTTVSSALVWYDHAHILTCTGYRCNPEELLGLYRKWCELVYLHTT